MTLISVGRAYAERVTIAFAYEVSPVGGEIHDYQGALGDARVIVVGTRGERPLQGELPGSRPHKLLHLADHPMLVVPAPS